MIKMKPEFQNMKKSAAELIKRGGKPVLTAGLLYIIISLTLSLLSPELFGSGMTQAELERMLQLYESGSVYELSDMLNRFLPTPRAYYINLAVSLFMMVLSAGYTIFLFNVKRGGKYELGNLFDAFAVFPRIIIIGILRTMLMSFGMSLFIIPGIAIAYMYSQAIYILLNHPEKSALQCMRESRILMRGHKLERLSLDLSLLGWILLVAVPLVGYIIELWTLPYLGLVKIMYYDKLTGWQPVPKQIEE